MSAGEHRINGQIDAALVRVIGSDGTQHGVLTVPEALKIARSEGLDLIELASSPGNPPVCKIVDYETYRSEQEQRRRRGRQLTITCLTHATIPRDRLTTSV